jgi:hypothetical protein
MKEALSTGEQAEPRPRLLLIAGQRSLVSGSARASSKPAQRKFLRLMDQEGFRKAVNKAHS